MKKFILLVGMAALFSHVNAQVLEIKKVPDAVIATFESAYPTASAVQWRKAGSYYLVDYRLKGNDLYITYNPSGEIIETGESIAVKAYPAPLTTYVKTKYKGEKIKSVYKVKDANGKTLWRGKVKTDYLYFDENGNYIKMETD